MEMAGVAVPCNLSPRPVQDTAAQSGLTSSVSLRQLVIQPQRTPTLVSVTELPVPMLPSCASLHSRCHVSHFGTALTDIQPYRSPLTSHQPRAPDARLTELSCFHVIAQTLCEPCNGEAPEVRPAAGNGTGAECAGQAAVKDAILGYRTGTHAASAIQELAVPLLPGVDTGTELFDEMLAEFTGPQLMPQQQQQLVSLASKSITRDSQATFHSCMAQDMILQDTLQTLPVIMFDEGIGCDEAESCVSFWQQLITECNIKPIRTGHLELHMDKSLSEKGQPGPASLQTYKRRFSRALQPARLPDSARATSRACVTATHSSLVSLIAGKQITLQMPTCNAAQFPEQLPHAVQAHLHKGQACAPNNSKLKPGLTYSTAAQAQHKRTYAAHEGNDKRTHLQIAGSSLCLTCQML